jgi:hypothetical protein
LIGCLEGFIEAKHFWESLDSLRFAKALNETRGIFGITVKLGYYEQLGTG